MGSRRKDKSWKTKENIMDCILIGCDNGEQDQRNGSLLTRQRRTEKKKNINDF